jgi:hypothetical protein
MLMLLLYLLACLKKKGKSEKDREGKGIDVKAVAEK